jgi:predicted phosphodiesterase
VKILALSDVHNNLVCVRKLRSLFTESFDAVVVAGDIGRDVIPAFFRILATFGCQILYVLGNWDHRRDHQKDFGPNVHFLDATFVTIGSITIAGFSDFPSDAERIALVNKLHLAKINLGRTILVCHYRLPRLYRDMPNLRLHIFGHIHRYAKTNFRGTSFLNVAALDHPVSARPRHKAKWVREDCRNYNAGSCTVIEIASDYIQAACVTLPHDYHDWTAIEDRCFHGVQWVPEETEWTHPTDPKLLEYTTEYLRQS